MEFSCYPSQGPLFTLPFLPIASSSPLLLPGGKRVRFPLTHAEIPSSAFLSRAEGCDCTSLLLSHTRFRKKCQQNAHSASCFCPSVLSSPLSCRPVQFTPTTSYLSLLLSNFYALFLGLRLGFVRTTQVMSPCHHCPVMYCTMWRLNSAWG